MEVEPSTKTLRLLLSMPPEMELKPEASRGSLKVMEKEEPEASIVAAPEASRRGAGAEVSAAVREEVLTEVMKDSIWPFESARFPASLA